MEKIYTDGQEIDWTARSIVTGEIAGVKGEISSALREGSKFIYVYVLEDPPIALTVQYFGHQKRGYESKAIGRKEDIDKFDRILKEHPWPTLDPRSKISESPLAQKTEPKSIVNSWGVPISGPKAEKRRALFPESL